MQLAFGPFRLDPVSQSLWRDGALVPLTRKAFGVLQCLVERRGDLVAKEEILARVWSDTVVGEAVLKVCVREIRRALEDDPREPRFIATAHRRGYRFIAPVAQSESPTPGGVAAGPAGAGWLEARGSTSAVVGREAPLAELRTAFAAACRGRRQVLFVTGEAGIGKTTLVDVFLREIGAARQVWIARGQCPPQHGAGEAYLPLLEAIDGLCRRPGGEGWIAELARRAPTWLLQMPALIEETERSRLLAQSLGATPQRMLREMVETLGALAADTPLVLVLEDLHWSDPATLDLISALARRREPACLLLLATYRPAEVILHHHPLRALKLDLQLHGYGTELALEFLDQDDVREALRARFGEEIATALAPLAYRRSDGNPLFLASIADHLVASGLVVADGDRFALTRPAAEVTLEVPESLRQMVEKRLERLPEGERAALEAASVSGAEFSSTAVAAALEVDPMQVEDVLADLGRRGELVRTCGTDERPDGTVASRLRFVHALYGEVLYDGIAPARRAQLHRRIAVGEEANYGSAAPQIAAWLALHYERGRDHAHAVKYLRVAAENAARRSASKEAVELLTRGLALLARLPESERLVPALAMRERRGLLRHSMGDLVGSAEEFAALAELAHASGRVDVEVRALVHQATVVYLLDRTASGVLFERANEARRDLPDPSIAIHLRSLGAYNRLRLRGFSEADRRACSEAVRVLGAAGERTLQVAHHGRSALFENVAGAYQAARRLAEDGLGLAIETGDLFEHLLCQYARAWALLHIGEWGEMQRGLDEEIELTERNDHPLWTTVFRLQRAWLCTEAFAFAPAAEICRDAVARGKEARHGLSQTLGSILLAVARLGSGEPAAAERALREIDTRLARDGFAVEWQIRPRLELVRAEIALANGALDDARVRSEVLLELAGISGDRAHLALGRRVRALAALRAGAPADAAREIEGALEALGDAEAPLAAWRVHATAAEVYEARRRRPQAARHRATSAGVLRRLADSLGGDAELRTAFLGAPAVREVLDRSA